MAINHGQVDAWLSELKAAWESGDSERALALFKSTKRYFERPFHAATQQDEIARYWEDIDQIQDIRFTYRVVAIDGNTAVTHWENWYTIPTSDQRDHLDGVFIIVFDDDGRCSEFRQWWFMEPK